MRIIKINLLCFHIKTGIHQAVPRGDVAWVGSEKSVFPHAATSTYFEVSGTFSRRFFHPYFNHLHKFLCWNQGWEVPRRH